MGDEDARKPVDTPEDIAASAHVYEFHALGEGPPECPLCRSWRESRDLRRPEDK